MVMPFCAKTGALKGNPFHWAAAGDTNAPRPRQVRRTKKKLRAPETWIRLLTDHLAESCRNPRPEDPMDVISLSAGRKQAPCPPTPNTCQSIAMSYPEPPWWRDCSLPYSVTVAVTE